MINRVVPIVIVLVAIGIFFAYVNPTYTGPIAASRLQIQSYDNALKAAKNFEDKENELKEAQARIPQGSQDRIQAFLPDGVDNVQLILDLNSLAERSGMKLTGFNVVKNEVDPGTPSPGTLGAGPASNTDSLDVTISGTGTYTSFRTFLSAMEWSLRPLDLVDLSIAPGDDVHYQYQLKLRMYWLR